MYDYNERQGPEQAPDNDAKDYFDADGKLLVKHYPFIYDQLLEQAKFHNKDISFLDANAPFEIRQADIKANKWEVGASYLRCSTTMQDSYSGQMVSCIAKGVQENIIILPELIAGDSGKTGKRANNPGINTVKAWAVAKPMAVLILFSISRCSRSLHKGLKLIKEDIYEYGVRAIAIAEQIDTSRSEWNQTLAFNLLIAEMQAKALPAFVRMGQKSHFEAGFQIGATPVGYRRVEVPEAGSTKKGKPKAVLEVVPEVKDLIVKHFKMIGAGMPLAEGCRLWNAEISGWPEELRRCAVDGRAKSKTMRPEAYRRMLSRQDYRGNFAFGRKRNHWLEGKEQIVQVDAPDQDVSRKHREHLRIVPDELFHEVQCRLADERRGRHGPRLDKEPPLSSSIIGLFRCAECGAEFYTYGTQYMHCPASTRGECGSWGTVHRENAVAMVISALRDHIIACSELTAEIVLQSRTLDAAMANEDQSERVAILRKAIKRQNQLLMNIAECFADTGMDAEAQQRQKDVQREKMRLEAELGMLLSRESKKRPPITEEQVGGLLQNFDTVLADAGSGKLGSEAKHRAAALIRMLTGGRIVVSFVRLEGRRRAFGVGRFTPHPLAALAEEGGVNGQISLAFPEIRLEFRELPRYARIADEAHRLYEEGMSMTEIGKRFKCAAGNVWEAYAYWHTSRGLEVPIKRPGMKNRNHHD